MQGQPSIEASVLKVRRQRAPMGKATGPSLSDEKAARMMTGLGTRSAASPSISGQVQPWLLGLSEIVRLLCAGRSNSSKAFRSFVALHVAFLEKHLDQFDQHLSLSWLNVDDQVHIRLHVRADIADAADGVDRVDTFRGLSDIHECSIPGRHASMPGGPIAMPRLQSDA
jgi:hypothetical protein